MVGKIAPHEGKELEYVVNGIKPLASIEASKQPELFERAIALRNVISVHYHNHELITITRKENSNLHRTFALLTSPQASIVVRSKEEKQRLLGRLFGYSEEDIDEFIKQDLGCACGQCDWDTGIVDYD